MAGDWLKFEHATPRKPEVFQIARTLGVTRFAAVGMLAEAWIWADQHGTTDEEKRNVNVRSVTTDDLDNAVGVTGLGAAMAEAGWLSADGNGLIFGNGGRHIGETAKQRGLTAKRVAEHKAKGKRKSNDGGVTSALPREEKRREEETTPPLPPSDAPPLEVGGVGPPPGREYVPHTVSVELIAKVRELVGHWKGKPLPLPPDDADLGEQILDRMLKDGKCQAVDIMAANLDDLKAAEKICREMQKAEWEKSGKGPAGKGKYFGLGHLKLALAEKKERQWEADKKADAAAAKANATAQQLVRTKAVKEEWVEIDAGWAKLPMAERTRLTRQQPRLLDAARERAAKAAWWQEQKGKGNGDT